MPVYDKEQNIQGCIPYSSSIELGSSLKTAQAFGALLVVFTSCIVVGLMTVSLFLEKCTELIYHVIRVFLPSAFCCQLLTFTAFASTFCNEIEDQDGIMVPATCIPGGAGVAAIFNCANIIVMMVLMSMISPPDHPVFQLYGTGNSMMISKGDDNISNSNNNRHSSKKKRQKKKERKMEKVSLTEPYRPGRDRVKTTIINGPKVKQIIKEITHPDGSQTITTTVEEFQPYELDEGDDDDDDESTVIEVL